MANPNNEKEVTQNTETVDNSALEQAQPIETITVNGKAVNLNEIATKTADKISSGEAGREQNFGEIAWSSGSKSLQEIKAAQALIEQGLEQKANESIVNNIYQGTGKFLASVVNNTGAAIWDTLGWLSDPMDWRVSDFSNSVAGTMGAMGFGAINSLTGKMTSASVEHSMNNVFKYLDNTIGDGENEFGNWFTRRADYVREQNQIYNTIDSGNSYVDYALNTGASVVGSVGGALLSGNVVGLAGKAAGMGKAMNTLMGAYVMTNSTAFSIAEGVQKQVYQDMMIKLAPQLEGMQTQAYDEAYQSALEEGLSPEAATSRAMQASRDTLNKFASENQPFHEQAQKAAARGAEVSVKAMMPAFILNLATSGMFLKGHYATRDILSKPAIFSRETLSEGIQEAIEEGIIENVAEDMGISYGMKGEYTIGDAMNTVLSKKALESALVGAIAGSGMAALQGAVGLKGQKKRYAEQQKDIEKWNKIGASVGQPNLLDNITSVHLSTQEVVKLAKQQQQLVDLGKTDEAKIIGDRILAVQAFQAFKSGTTKSLIENYEKIANDKAMKPEIRQRAKEGITTIQKMENIYLETSNKYYNASHVFSNRVNNHLLENAERELQSKISQKKIEASAVIEEALKQGELSLTGEKRELVGEGEKTLRVEISDQTLDYDLDNLLSSPYDDNQKNKEVYNTFKEGATKNQAVKELLDLQQSLSTLQQQKYENNKTYNTITSKEFQREQKHMGSLSRDLEKLEKELKGQEGTDEYMSAVDNLLSKYEKRISKPRLEYTKTLIELSNEQAKAANNKVKEEALNQAIVAEGGIPITEDNAEKVVPAVDNAEKINAIADKINSGQQLSVDEKQLANKFKPQITKRLDELKKAKEQGATTEGKESLQSEETNVVEDGSLDGERNAMGDDLMSLMNELNSEPTPTENKEVSKLVEKEVESKQKSFDSIISSLDSKEAIELVQLMKELGKEEFTASNFTRKLRKKPNEVSAMLDALVKDGHLVKDGDKYSLATIESSMSLADTIKLSFSNGQFSYTTGNKSTEELEKYNEALKEFRGDNRYLIEEVEISEGNFEVTITDMGSPKVGEVIESFEPKEVNDKISDDKKEAITTLVGDYVENLKASMGNEQPTFEQFVRDYIKSVGRENADKFFNLLAKAWGWNNYPAVDYKNAYNNIFKNRKELALDSLSLFEEAVFMTDEEAKELNEKNEVKDEPVIVDGNNVPVVVPRFEHTGRVVSDASPRLGFSSKSAVSEQIQTEEGFIKTVWRNTERIPTDKGMTKSTKLLHPDKYQVGTKLKMVIPSEAILRSITVSIYGKNGMKTGATETYGEFIDRKLKENPDFKSTQEYEDTLPILMMDEDGDYVAFAREPNWYNASNFDGDIEEAAYNARAIRKSAIKAYKNGTQFEVEITENKTGVPNLLNEDEEFITINESNPQAIVGVILNGKIEIRGGVFDGVIDNNPEFFDKANGKVVDIRRWGSKLIDGKLVPTYRAFPVSNENISESDVTTIFNALQTYLTIHSATTSSEVKGEARKIINALKHATTSEFFQGFDIYDKRQLDSFLKQFVILGNQAVQNTEPRHIAEIYNKSLKTGLPYLFSQSGKIVFGISGDAEAVVIDPRKFDPTNQEYIAALEYLKQKVLPAFQLNISKEQIKNDTPVVSIDSSGKVKIKNPSYNDYVKSNLKTNVLSFNLGTEENPNYVTRIQPSIYYDAPLQSRKEGTTSVPKEETSPVKEQKVNAIVEVTSDEELEQLVEAEGWDLVGETVEEKVEDLKELLSSGTEEATEFVEEFLEADEDVLALIKQAESQVKWVNEYFDEEGNLTDNTEDESNFSNEIENYIQGVLNAGNFEGTVIEFVDHIVTEKGTAVAMRNMNKGEKILFVKELMQKKFDEKAWTKPVKQADGSFAQPLAENEFSSVEEWILFALLHEKAHETIFRNEPIFDENGNPVYVETIGDYETRINNAALERLNSEFRESYEPKEIGDDLVKALTAEIFKIAGLSPNHQGQLVDYMFNLISNNISFDYGVGTPESEIDRIIKEELGKVLGGQKQMLEDTLVKLKAAPKVPQIEKLIEKYTTALNKINAVNNNVDALIEEAKFKIEKYTGITKVTLDEDVNSEEDEDTQDDKSVIEDSSTEREHNHSKTALEENGKNKISYKLKRFMSGIKDINSKSGLPNKGVMGVDLFVPFDTVWDTVQGFLADAPMDFKSLMDILRSHKDAHAWIPSLIEKLENADNETRNHFVHTMGKHPLKMEFIMYSFDRKSGKYSLKVYDTNSSAITRKIKDKWYNSLLSESPLVKVIDGEYVTDKEVAKELLAEFESWNKTPSSLSKNDSIGIISKIKNGLSVFKLEPDSKFHKKFLSSDDTFVSRSVTYEGKVYELTYDPEKNTVSIEPYEEHAVTKALRDFSSLSKEDKATAIQDVQRWISYFGIELADDAVVHLFEKGIYSDQQLVSPVNVFKKSSSTAGPIGLLANWLDNIAKGAIGTDIMNEDSEDNNPLRQSAIENSLTKLQSRYTEAIVTNSFRDGKKSIYGFTAFKFLTDRIKQLVTSPKLREELKSLSYSKGSAWLQMFEDETLRNKFQISHLGLTALKEQGKKIYGTNNDITKLSDADHELVKLGMFMDTKQGSTNEKFPGTNIGMRVVRFLFPTMSDKSTMTVIKTFALNLMNKDFYRATVKGEIAVTRQIEDVLISQLVEPEMDRILNFNKNVGKSNIKGYDDGAKQFLLLPALNELKVSFPFIMEDGTTDEIEITLNEMLQKKGMTKEVVMANAGELIRNELQNYIRTLTKEKIEVWKNNGFVTGENENMTSKFLDAEYLNAPGLKDSEKGNLNPIQFAAYDYVINSLIANSNAFMTMIGDPALYYKSNPSKSYLEQSKDTFINVGKRLAAMIAPGDKIADSENEQYFQVFLKDKVSMAENIEFLTKLLDDKPFSYEKWNDINNMPETDSKEKAAKKEALDSFMESYPNSAAYFEIESTDAQEYTTWQEHLHILEKMGRTPDVAIGISPVDIREAREMFANGTPISEMTDAQKIILKKVMQPIKPVYSGQIYDKGQDVMRMVYIKTSSYPLIPQLTEGLEIDKLRVAMQGLEKKGKKVRASYQSGNKVGGLSKPLTVFNGDGSIKDLKAEDLEGAALVLNRKDFKIQLDVPFKSLKRKEDTVTMGTQLTKLLFGNGIMDVNGFELNGKKYNGTELEKIYTDSFIKLSKLKKEKLYKELGLDPVSGLPTSEEGLKKSALKLQKLLKEEAIGRGYSRQDVEALGLIPVYRDGVLVDIKFKSPLWLSTNSNRFESLLNAIVNNRLIKMKFPGDSYVIGSEEGFRFQSGLKNIDKNKIVWTNKWKGSLQAAKYDKDGKVSQAQVIVPSKFRDKDGKLIELLAKDKSGDYIHVEKTKEGFRLKEGKVADELLSITSFRIPTSGHVSAAQLEIVGFLPQEAGNLMILPKNLMVQKGLDFDIDKETTYQLWHTQNEDGNFVEHTEDEEKVLLNTIIKIHKSVLTNPDAKVQSKINAVLSIDYAKQQAEAIDKIVTGTKDEKYFTPLSDEYQKQKMFLGASGKVGIGAYSLDVTSHSLFEQAKAKGEQLILMDGEAQLNISFGKVGSTGELGEATTIDGDRTIAEVLAERQNIATDNEKEQVMGKVNLNGMTLDVDKVLTLLGFDKGEDGKSIAFLFLSQPILKDYVLEMSNASSNTAEFSTDKEEKVIAKLFEKYNVPKDFVFGSETDEKYAASMNNPFMETQIREKGQDSLFQAAILNRFLILKGYGEAIRSVQSAINTDSKGLGKSIIENGEKIKAVEGLVFNPLIKNTSALIGDYKQIQHVQSKEEYDKLIEDGYVRLGSTLIKPTTINGVFSVNALSAADILWSKHFPYESPVMKSLFAEIIPLVTGTEAFSTKIVERKQLVLKEVKKFLNSLAVKFNLITGSVKEERIRLFFDREGKDSLATYLKSTIKNTPALKSNKFLQRLEFTIDKADFNKPSTISFNNTSSGNFDEEYLYNAIMELMSRNIVLPSFNGEVYTSKKLAQDLINYALLEGGVQEATQFAKVIPLAYLESMGVLDTFNGVDFNSSEVFGLNWNEDKEYHEVSDFTMQFAQHNPNIMPKLDTVYPALDVEKIDVPNKMKVLNIPESHTGEIPVFLSVRKDKQFYLWKYDGRNSYILLETKGTIGMSEYDPNAEETSIVTQSSKEFNPVEDTEPPTPKPSTSSLSAVDRFKLTQNNLRATVASIIDSNFGPVSELAKVLNSVLPEGVQVKVEDIPRRGKYNRKTNIITIDKEWAETATDEELARTILKELVHATTDAELLKYTDPQGKIITSGAPEHIRTLVTLFKEVQKLFEKQLPELERKMREKESLTPNEKRVIYGGYNLLEFVEMMLTQPEFQKVMAETKFRATDKTLWDKVKEFFNQLLSISGTKFESESIAAQAIDSILTLIEEKKAESKRTEVKETESKVDKSDTQVQGISNEKLAVANKLLNEGFENLDLEVAEVNLNDFSDKPLIQKYLSSGYEVTQNEYNFMLNNQNEFNSLLEHLDKNTNFENSPVGLEEFFKGVKLPEVPIVVNTDPVSIDTLTEESLIEQVEALPQMTKYELFPNVYANKEQTEAIEAMVDFIEDSSESNEISTFVLIGRGGTGKTTITKKVMELAGRGKKIGGAATQHTAKNILAKSLGAETYAIASMTGVKEVKNDKTGKVEFKVDKRFKAQFSPIARLDVLIFDESSMISKEMVKRIYEIAKAYNPTLKIIFMGDNVQLPPIGENESVTFSKATKPSYNAKLVTRMRQGEESPIVPLSDIFAANVETESPIRRVSIPRKDNFNPLTNEGVLFMNDGNVSPEMVNDFKKDLHNTKAIVYHNKKRKSVTSTIRKAIWGEALANNDFNVGEVLVGEAVNQNKGILNGEFYIVEEVIPMDDAVVLKDVARGGLVSFPGFYLKVKNSEGKSIKIKVPSNDSKTKIEDFQKANAAYASATKSWGEFFENKDALDSIALDYGYAITSHKAQGNTFNNVYVFEDDITSSMATNKAVNQSLYVAVTRPRKKLVMVSSASQPTIEELQGMIGQEYEGELPPPIEMDGDFTVGDTIESFDPKEQSMKEVEVKSKFRNTDGSRKRYLKYETALKKAQTYNKAKNEYQAKIIKVMGEKGDARIYYAIQLVPRTPLTNTSMPTRTEQLLNNKIDELIRKGVIKSKCN